MLGIKEAPVAEVQRLKAKEAGRKRTWMMFSHTHKGQVSDPHASELSCIAPGSDLMNPGLQHAPLICLPRRALWSDLDRSRAAYCAHGARDIEARGSVRMVRRSSRSRRGALSDGARLAEKGDSDSSPGMSILGQP